VTTDYCTAIERHLCQKNEGHLIRVVGPAFEIVTRWEHDGVPLKVAFQGIDRFVERYHRARPRRRPVRIEFCDTDVVEVFDEWRRALGLTARPSVGESGLSAGEAARVSAGETMPLGDGVPEDEAPRERPGRSLRAHLERAAVRLSSARATGRVGPSADRVLESLSAELDLARERVRGLRGEARHALLDRLIVLDRTLIDAARDALEAPDRAAIEDEARQQLLAFRERMAPASYERALGVAVDRLVRDRAGLPELVFA
jgi:hypothetical protein